MVISGVLSDLQLNFNNILDVHPVKYQLQSCTKRASANCTIDQINLHQRLEKPYLKFIESAMQLHRYLLQLNQHTQNPNSMG